MLASHMGAGRARQSNVIAADSAVSGKNACANLKQVIARIRTCRFWRLQFFASIRRKNWVHSAKTTQLRFTTE